MKRRLVSAAVMAIICIPLVLIGGMPFRIGVGVLAIFAYKEFLDLKGFKRYPKSVILIGLFVILMLVFSNRSVVFAGASLDYRYIALAILALFLPCIFFFDSKKTYSTSDAFKLLGFILFLGVTLNLATNILIYDREYFYLLLLVTILTDTFAFFTGRSIGRHTFTKISPNKTIEGCIGGIVMGTALSAIFYQTFIGIVPVWRAILPIMGMSIISEIGDLFFSAIKREHDIKDFSNLIPGHGGILDRIDSLTFVIIAYVLFKSFI